VRVPVVAYPTPSAYLDELVSEPFRLDTDGCLLVPMRPGLSVTLDPAAMRRFGI
jgi:D-galactarolactone cycloisomerase